MDRGLKVVRESLTKVKAYVQDLQAVDRTLRPNDETTGEEREAQFILRRQEWESSADPMHQHCAQMMRSFEPGGVSVVSQPIFRQTIGIWNAG